jgi:UDP-glucose 4-epimerase
LGTQQDIKIDIRKGKMRILISGAAGYIASWLARNLIKQNHEVTLWDNYRIPSNLTEIENVKIEKRDIRDSCDVSEFDVIFHLGAVSGINDCEENKEEAYDINVRGTFNLLKTCQGRFLFPSTSAVYGIADASEIDETHPTLPRSFYGQNKLDAENMVKLHHSYGILRFSNIYGKGYTCKRTVADCFIENALNGSPLMIHGDGKQRRDFVHINDVIRSYILVMQSDINGIYNIGGNEALSINEIADLVKNNYRKIFGDEVIIKRIPIDCGMLWKDFNYLSKLAKDVLRYEANYTISDEIRSRLIAYKKSEKRC